MPEMWDGLEDYPEPSLYDKINESNTLIGCLFLVVFGALLIFVMSVLGGDILILATHP